MKFEEMTIEEKNRLITEKLFGCWHEYKKFPLPKESQNLAFRGATGAIYRTGTTTTKCAKCGFSYGIVGYQNRNFYGKFNTHEYAAELRKKIEEKSLVPDFVGELTEILGSQPETEWIRRRIRGGNVYAVFEVLNASPSEQADAIVKVLLDE